MPRLPRKISGTTPQAVEWNAMIDYLISLRPANSVGVQTSHTSLGVVRKVITQPLNRSAKKSGEVAIGFFTITAINNATLTCTGTDGSVAVAKPFNLRFPSPSYSLSGLTVTYASESLGPPTVRTASWTRGALSGSEIQTIIKPYMVGEYIIAAKIPGETGLPSVDWIDLNVDARAWAKKYT